MIRFIASGIAAVLLAVGLATPAAAEEFQYCEYGVVTTARELVVIGDRSEWLVVSLVRSRPILNYMPAEPPEGADPDWQFTIATIPLRPNQSVAGVRVGGTICTRGGWG